MIMCWAVDFEYATDRGLPYRVLVDADTAQEAKEFVRAGQTGNGRIVIVRTRALDAQPGGKE